MRICLAILTLCAALGGCTSPQDAPKSTAAPASAPLLPGQVRWPIDSLQSIAGQTPTILGNPRVVHNPSGAAISFNGINDGLILPIVPLAGMKSFTLEVLFKPESGGPAEQRFMHSEDEAGNRMTLETRLTPEGKWSLDTFLLSGTNRRTLLDQTRQHPADQWYWVALRYDGATMSDYINGVMDLQGPMNFPPMGAAGRVSLGVRLNQVNWFKGQIREVRITTRALPDSELQSRPPDSP